MPISRINRPDVSSSVVREALARRKTPYYSMITYGRHIGYLRDDQGDAWYARIRTRAESYYRRRLGWARSSAQPAGLDYEEALAAAHAWFSSSGIGKFASDIKPLGVRRELIVCPVGDRYCVAHALAEYVEWKRLAAAQSHFETNLSLINHHIIPRLAHLPLDEFNGEHLRRFVRAVLETPPKRGNRQIGVSRSIESLNADQLRKRKKTVNTLIGILRVSFHLAWEGGKTDSDRSWRCLRTLPVVDRPRTLHLSRAECRELLAACRPDVARLVLGALYTGCRLTELLNMRCEDVGRDGYGVYVLPLKTYRPRFVFLPDEGMAWFLSLTKNKKPKDLLFVKDSGTPWYGNHKHLFKAAVREAGLPDDFTFHGLRHTYASQLIQAGATVYSVADQFGHADPTTVLRTYGHMSPQIREAEVRQRFSPVDEANASLAKDKAEELRAWRASLHGGDWREYAKITDVRIPEEPRQLGFR